MCIIVDANAAFELSNKTDDGMPVLQWLLNPRVKAGLIIGGKLAAELRGIKFSQVLLTLRRAGRLHIIPDQRLKEKEQSLITSGACRSNDVHVVALALATRCNVVFTRDVLLHADLRFNSVAGNRITIYQNASHSHLLVECRCI